MAGSAIDIGKVWWIYLIFTGVAYITFWWLGGASHWEAVNHALTAVSTGGFTITNNSYALHGEHRLIHVIPMMLIGALSFERYRKWFTKGDWRSMFLYPPHIVFMALLILGIGAIGLLGDPGSASGWGHVIFQFTSALATCGFQSTDLGHWGVSQLVVLIIAMFIGGTVISTVGGVKVDRFVRLFQLLRKGSGQLNKKERQHLSTLRFFILLWVSTMAVSTGIMVMLWDEPFVHLLFEMNSALSCVGLSTGITSPDLGIAPKLVLSFTMLIGRLELIPLVLLLGRVPEEVD